MINRYCFLCKKSFPADKTHTQYCHFIDGKEVAFCKSCRHFEAEPKQGDPYVIAG